MNPRSISASIAVAALAVLGIAAPASAAPIFSLDIHHGQTNFAPGGGPAPATVATVTAGSASPAANEVQEIRIGGTTGEYHLRFDPDGAGAAPAQFTAALPYDADAAAVQAALRALPAIGSPNVDVRSPGGRAGTYFQYTVTFAGALAATDVSQLEIVAGATPLGLGPEYWFDIENLGDTDTSGTLTLRIDLPEGITQHSFRSSYTDDTVWSCAGVAPDPTRNIECTTTDSIPRQSASYGLILLVDVDPGIAPGSLRFASASISGGGAAAVGPVLERTLVDPVPAGFGILAETFRPDLLDVDFDAGALEPARAAGARPDLLTVPFDFNAIDAPTPQNAREKGQSGSIRNLAVDTPPGFLGDPTVVGECAAALLSLSECPIESQVGVAYVKTQVVVSTPGPTVNFDDSFRPVYNMTPPFGVVNDLAFTVAGNPIHARVSLDPARGYAITSEVSDINETVTAMAQRLTLWGVPADPAHDAQRCPGSFNAFAPIQIVGDCPAGLPLKPFLTAPFECGTEHSMRLHSYDSWQDSGDFGPDIVHTLPGELRGCEEVPFEPTISLAPTTDVADSHSGLDVRIELPQHNSCDPGPPVECEIATSPLKDATVTTPEGLTVNPASANGLDACAPAQIGLGTDDPVTCPVASRVASVTVTTPVLPDPIEGVVYLATPHDNPFDTLLAGYIVLTDPERGILIKIPGRIDVDPATGQITGSFADNPQQPFSQFDLHFKGGAHSTLITPKTCGDYTTNAQFSPWSGTASRAPSDSFAIRQGAGGGPCAGSEAALPNAPSFDAGPVSPVSGNYSPFVLHLRRADGSQRFSALNVALPPGLAGKLAGTELCPDGALAAAQSKSGKAEQASPSCPLDSRVGAVHAAAGAGPDPYNAAGTAYLSGPYKGAPVSIATIVPAVAGPFDLGNVVVRAPVFVDPVTAQISTTTDPFPQMLEGIPLNVRAVSVVMDRPDFTLTGTSCNPSSVNGLLTSTLGQSVPLAARYQLSDCRRLPFKPKLVLRLKGKTKRGGHPQLTAIVLPRSGDANIASVSVSFPRSEFLENAHIRTICTRPDFAADNCPAGAVYGRSTVWTPLLDYPLTGNVYLRSSDNLLPDVVPDLRGPAHQPIRVEAAGRTDSVRGGIRNTFDFFPDAPFSRAVLKMQGGNKGLLVNSRDICARTYRAVVKYRAHNGRAFLAKPKLKAQCKRKKKRKAKRRGHGRARQSAVARRSAVR